MYLMDSQLMDHSAHCDGGTGEYGAGESARLSRVVRRFSVVAREASGVDELVLALLVAATAQQGLGFNRAFFFSVDQVEGGLVGEFAIGPASVEEAESLWEHIRRAGLDLVSIFMRVKERFPAHDRLLNQRVKGVRIPASHQGHPLIVALNRRESFCVGRSPGCLFQWRSMGLDRFFSKGGFVVAPLISGKETFGVVVADNGITLAPIYRGHVDGLSILTDMAGAQMAALERERRLEARIRELEQERAKLSASHELVIESERRHAMGQLAEQLSHHLRNPISILGGVVKRLHSRSDLQAVRPYMEAILEQTQRMEESLNTLFSFSEPPELHLRKGKVSEAIRRAAEALEPAMRPKGISWHLCIRGPEPYLLVDSQRLEGAFIHILKNSIEAIPDGGLIFITQEDGGKEVVVQIADTGSGMMNGLVNKAAEPFFSMKNRGLGLGLSIARQVVEAHDGRLLVRPNRLGGVTVEVALPHRGGHV